MRIMGYHDIDRYSTTACNRVIQRRAYTSLGYNVAKGSDIDFHLLLFVWKLIIIQYQHSCFKMYVYMKGFFTQNKVPSSDVVYQLEVIAPLGADQYKT